MAKIQTPSPNLFKKLCPKCGHEIAFAGGIEICKKCGWRYIADIPPPME